MYVLPSELMSVGFVRDALSAAFCTFRERRGEMEADLICGARFSHLREAPPLLLLLPDTRFRRYLISSSIIEGGHPPHENGFHRPRGGGGRTRIPYWVLMCTVRGGKFALRKLFLFILCTVEDWSRIRR